ncbi:MAG: two-component system response regulator, partial [Piscirickettsiaceae bacterium CG_4_10_14_3_um_filter_44_349]
ITEGDGRTRSEEFDPAVLAAFKKIHTQFDAIFNRMN